MALLHQLLRDANRVTIGLCLAQVCFLGLNKSLGVGVCVMMTDQKTALFITGVPGTGKTHQMFKIIGLFGIEDPFIIQMDRHRIPGQQGSARYTKTDVMLTCAIEENKNVVYENMAMSKWVRDNVVRRLCDRNYKIIFVLLWTEPHQALAQRVWRRERINRWVNPRYVSILEDRTPLEFFDTCQCLGKDDRAVLLYNRWGTRHSLQKVATMANGIPPEFHAGWTPDAYLALAQLPPAAKEGALQVLVGVTDPVPT